MPGLHRIILIDTHLPGVVELKLDGHTNICGTNASGKTTLQRLIPVFYGEYPSRVVPATRDSFERWYLPRESSFIIYEYARNEGDLCQVVLASTGSGVNYRFIAKPFELDDYLYKNKGGKHTSVSMNELARSLKRSNVLVTNLLNTKEYRAVLQNDRGVVNACANSRELLGYARIFSLCDSSQHLRHIEKLAKAVHSKEGKMETIKAMIAAILEEDGVQPPNSSLRRNRVEDWIRECHLIKEFDAVRPEFAKLERADHQLSQNELRLAQLHQQFSFDVSKLSADMKTQQTQLEDALHELKHIEKQWSEQRDELNQILSSARADIDKYSAELDSVEREYEDWQAQDIDTLQNNLQQLPQWQSELDMVNTRYALLTEKHQDVESAYNKRVAELSEKLNNELHQYSEQKSQLQDTLEQQRQQERDALRAIQDEFLAQRSEYTEKFSQQLNQYKVEHASIEAELKNAGYSEFEQTQLDLLDAAIKEASAHEDKCRETLRRAQQQYTHAVKQRGERNTELEHARRALIVAQKEFETVQSLLFPGEGSLLEFVRKNMPEWEATVGKIIDPALLTRTDLKPEFHTDQTGVYGLVMALEKVATPEFAKTEAQLNEQLATCKSAMESANEQQNEAEDALSTASEVVRNAELEQAKCESDCRTAEAARRRAQQDKDALQQEYQTALASRKQEARKKLKANELVQTKCQQQQDEMLQELSDQQREAETEHQFHWQQVIDDVRAQLQKVEQHSQQAREKAAQERKQTEQWLANELDNRGVDIDEIGILKKRIKQLKQDIQFTDANRHKVKDYERWYQTVFNGHKINWQKALSKARKSASDAERQLTAHESEYRQQREQLKAQQQSAEQALKTAKEQDQAVATLQRSLTKLSLPTPEISAESATDTIAVSQRISEGQALLQEREELLQDIKTLVEHFDQLIAAQAGTGLSDTWERSREECTYVNAQGVRTIDHRRLVSHLAQLLNVIVPQKLQGLREQGRIFGAYLTQYYKVLEDIDRRIASHSRRITQEVEEELFLDGVSDSAVKIRSRISELEFWPELKAFNRLYDEWMEQGATELPDDEYGQSMRRVLDILGRDALSGGISKLLDIELHLKEGNSDLVIRTDRQLNESSSHGMAYLILCKFLLAFTRLLRGEADAVIHWPIDELGTLHQSNVKKIFDACQKNRISVVGAFPNPESDVLSLFNNRYLIDKNTRKLQVVQPKVSAIKQRLQQKQTSKEVQA
ncbi:ATP-binding protein [Aestuariibacter salexigens]|uniref:ATP-binding protein n=1 Tax=Aestuariibacter salexigens TaxID=226010 RepID=UPI000425ACAF|nr:ATP-binding protein [Aestuariibacter salexigens]